jgi:hypothetical protein
MRFLTTMVARQPSLKMKEKKKKKKKKKKKGKQKMWKLKDS